MAVHTAPLAIAQNDGDSGDVEYFSEESADYGIYNKMDQLTSEMESHINSPQILQETKAEIDAMVEGELSTGNRIPGTYEVLDTGMNDPRAMNPPIFSDIDRNPMINNTTVLDWILPQPMTEEGSLNYWAVTKYPDRNNNTITEWGQGSMRRTLFYPHFSLDKWLYLDIDHDASTGNLGGNDVRVRLSFVFENIVIERPNILPTPNTGTVTFKGGLRMEVDSYGSLPKPIQINIVKGFSYDNNNYIFTITIELQPAPPHTEMYLGAEKIKIGNVSIMQFLANMSQGLGGAFLSDISGPYTVTYETSEDIPYLKATVGVIKLFDQELLDKGWLKLNFNKAHGHDSIPRDGRLWINSENFYSPLDMLIWKAGEKTGSSSKIPALFSLEYCEESENLTYAKARLQNLPAYLNVTIDYSQEKRGKNLTIMDYSASGVIDLLTFETYQFPRTDSGFNMDIYRATDLMVRHIPKKFHIEVTSDLGRQFDFSIYRNPSYSIMGQIVDNVIGRIAGRFYRVGIILRSLPENMMTLPSRHGWLIIDAYNDYFAELQYRMTSGQYLFNPDRNYIGFYRDHSIDQYIGKYDVVEFAISGHLKNIERVYADFDRRTEIELDNFGHEPLDALTLDGSDYVFLEISNLPNHVRLRIFENQVFYETDPQDYNDPQNWINSISFYSDVNGRFLNLNILNMPGNFSFGKQGDRIVIDTGDEFIDMVEFAITDRSGIPIRQIKDGNFVYLHQDKDFAYASGRIFGLQRLDYSTGNNGYLNLKIKEESVMRFKVIDKQMSDLDIQVVLSPFPTDFSMELPNIINSSIIRFPDIVNITGIVDYGNMMFSLGTLGQNILEIMSNVSANLVNSIGGIGTDFTFSYNLNDYDSTMDLIAILKKGDYEALEPVDWTHGICMNQRVRGNEIDFYGNIYLQGLPSSADISLFISADQLRVDLRWTNYNPRYPWLIMNTKGLQNQDVVVFLSGIQPNINLDIHVDMYTKMEIGGRMSGDISLRFTDSDGDLVNLDQMYVRFRKYGNITSIREAYLPNIPGVLEAKFSIENDMFAEYNASVPIEYLYIKLSKLSLGKWSNAVVIFHDLPTHFSAKMMANTNFSLTDPLPVQNLPDFDIRTFGSDTLDLFMTVDGSGFGQRGTYLVYLRDIGDHTKGELKANNDYEFNSDGVGYMDITVFNLRMLKQFRLDSLSIRGQDLRSFTVSVYMLYGLYPIFNIANVDGKALQVEIHNTVFLFGREITISAVIMDIAFREAGPAEVPTEMPMATDRFSVDMEKHPRHIIIPMPLVTPSTIRQL
jgi:hypothetical protein